MSLSELKSQVLWLEKIVIEARIMVGETLVGVGHWVGEDMVMV